MSPFRPFHPHLARDWHTAISVHFLHRWSRGEYPGAAGQKSQRLRPRPVVHATGRIHELWRMLPGVTKKLHQALQLLDQCRIDHKMNLKRRFDHRIPVIFRKLPHQISQSSDQYPS